MHVFGAVPGYLVVFVRSVGRDFDGQGQFPQCESPGHGPLSISFDQTLNDFVAERSLSGVSWLLCPAGSCCECSLSCESDGLLIFCVRCSLQVATIGLCVAGVLVVVAASTVSIQDIHFRRVNRIAFDVPLDPRATELDVSLLVGPGNSVQVDLTEKYFPVKNSSKTGGGTAPSGANHLDGLGWCGIIVAGPLLSSLPSRHAPPPDCSLDLAAIPDFSLQKRSSFSLARYSDAFSLSETDVFPREAER